MSWMARRKIVREGKVSRILKYVVGEICCVTKTIKCKKAGSVRYFGSDFPAKADSEVRRGRWVRVMDHERGVLKVTPLNVWLGSCCC